MSELEMDLRLARQGDYPGASGVKRMADTITALRAEVVRMRDALERIVDAPMIDHANPERGAQAIARAALTQTKDTTDDA